MTSALPPRLRPSSPAPAVPPPARQKKGFPANTNRPPVHDVAKPKDFNLRRLPVNPVGAFLFGMFAGIKPGDQSYNPEIHERIQTFDPVQPKKVGPLVVTPALPAPQAPPSFGAVVLPPPPSPAYYREKYPQGFNLTIEEKVSIAVREWEEFVRKHNLARQADGSWKPIRLPNPSRRSSPGRSPEPIRPPLRPHTPDPARVQEEKRFRGDLEIEFKPSGRIKFKPSPKPRLARRKRGRDTKMNKSYRGMLFVVNKTLGELSEWHDVYKVAIWNIIDKRTGEAVMLEKRNGKEAIKALLDGTAYFDMPGFIFDFAAMQIQDRLIGELNSRGMENLLQQGYSKPIGPGAGLAM